MLCSFWRDCFPLLRQPAGRLRPPHHPDWLPAPPHICRLPHCTFATWLSAGVTTQLNAALSEAMSTNCAMCKSVGATARCAHASCRSCYHLHCSERCKHEWGEGAGAAACLSFVSFALSLPLPLGRGLGSLLRLQVRSFMHLHAYVQLASILALP